MNNRERIINAATGGPVDRQPLPFWLGTHCWASTLRRWRQESGIADLDIREHFGLDRFFVAAPVEYGPFPHFESEELCRDGAYVVKRDWRGLTVRNRVDGESMPEFLGYPVHDADQWRRYKEERLEVAFEERFERFETDFVPRYGAGFVDAPVQVGEFPWGVFGTTRDLLGAERLLTGFYEEPDLIHDIMETLCDLWCRVLARVAASVQIDHVHIWEDMSGRQGSLISPALVEEFMMPRYDRIARLAAAHGVRLVSVDTDGACGQLIPVFMDHGMNAMMPFEAQAGNDIVEIGARYPELSIWGGLDKRALAEDTEAIDRELRKAERMVARGRYVIGFDHSIPDNVPWCNFRYAMDGLRQICGVAE